MDNEYTNLEKEQKKIKPKNINFIASEKGNEKINIKKSREEFDLIEKNYSEDFSLEYTVKKIKEKKMNNNKNYCFRYEKKKYEFELKGYPDDKKEEKEEFENLKNSEVIKDENLPIKELLIKSRPLSSKIYIRVSELNYDESVNEILFKNLEAHILVDVARTISKENRYFNMLLVCGLASALNYLRIPYSLSLIGDSNFKIRIKETREPHDDLILRKLYDCCFIKRNITSLASCIKYFLDKDTTENDSINKVYYIFSNGYDYELAKYKSWRDNIFNNEKNSFSFTFLRPKAKNLENFKYLEKIWGEFASIKTISRMTLTKTSIEEINDLKNLVENLSTVLLRKKNEIKDNSPKNEPLFKINQNFKLTQEEVKSLIESLKNESLNKFDKLYIKKIKLPLIYDNQKEDKRIFKKICTQTGKIIRLDKLDNKTQLELLLLAKEFKQKKERMKLGPLNIIFKPNLPTQAILVEEGTHLDITELIKYSINKVPNPKLYREIRDGFIKNYGVSIVIDTSVSCINDICIVHTIQTLKVLFNSLSHDNIPCLDVILSREKEPIILASEKSANEILSERSPFWGSFCSCFEGVSSSDLASAIKAAYNLIRARRKEYTNYIFVLTAGLYSLSERDRIIEVVNSCNSKNINLFGIGVGIAPFGIEKLFSKVIYAQNPYKLIEGISLFFGDISKYKKENMENLVIEPNKDKHFIKNSDEIDKDIKEPKYIKLKEKLLKILIPLESFTFYNKEIGDNKDGVNPEGQGMYKKDLYKGQKILFAMFFSCDLKSQKSKTNSKDELNEQQVHPKYVKLNKPFNNQDNIYSVLQYYGYEIEVVTGYEKAITELCRKDLNNKCIYNSLWVVSGKAFPEVPSFNSAISRPNSRKTVDPNDPYYVEQFVECAIKFWQNGGSLVLLAENDPYTFQANLILKKLVFPDGRRVQFTIGGDDHKGGQILMPDGSGKLDKKQTFNSKIQEVSNDVCKYQRASIAHNIKQIFEGYTVSYTIGGSIEPFIPFTRDSDGGINSLFYNGSDEGNCEGEGDIFIDCGYTKFFLNMKEKGTSQYLQNIGGFIGSSERRHEIFKENPGKYRPKAVDFRLNKNKLYNYPKIPFDVVYLVDATESMKMSINNVKKYCLDIAEILKKEKLYNFKFGAVFYRDPVDTKDCDIQDKNDFIDLTDNMKAFKEEMRKIEAYGGLDGPEDWVGGYDLALHGMHWRNGKKLIIHITDSGAHGTEYSQGDRHPEEGWKLTKLIKECSSKEIIIAAFQIKNPKLRECLCQQSFNKVKDLYREAGKEENFESKDFDQNRLDPGYFTDLVVKTITKVT